MSSINVSGPGAEVKVVSGTPVAASAAGTTVTAAGIDRIGANFVILEGETGAVTGAPSAQTLDAKIQHCATLAGTYTDFQPGGVAAAGALSQITAANTRKRKTINLQGAFRYIKVSTTVGFTGGTSPTLANSVKLIFGGFDVVPAQVDD